VPGINLTAAKSLAGNNGYQLAQYVHGASCYCGELAVGRID